MIIPKLLVELQGVARRDNMVCPVEHISFYNHQVIVDGVPAETHFDGEYYYWHRINGGGQEENGALKLFSHGLMGNGVISVQGNNMAFSVQAMISYSIVVDKQAWINFEMGFVEDEKGQKHAFGKFIIPNDPTGSDLFNKNASTVFSVVQNKDKQEVLHVHFDVDPAFCCYGMSKWIAGDFDFTMDYSKFMGYVYEYDMTSSDYHGPKHDAIGSYIDAAFINKIKSAVQKYYANLPQGPIFKSPTTAFPQSLSKAKALAAEVNKSVEDLYTLPAPDMENLHQLSFAKLKSLMIYAVDDQWRNWFGEAKPDVGPNSPLTQNDVNLLNNSDIDDFLKNKFAVGYLTQAFSQSDVESIKKQFERISGYQDKLGYFWKGSGDACFSSDKGYNLASSSLTDSAFVSCVPGLSPYMSDNPQDWAKKLYDYCTTPFTLNGLALQNTLDGRTRLTHLCNLLHSLDHEARLDGGDGKMISYATSLYSRVMDVRLNFISIRFSPDNKEECAEFLTEFFVQYFNSLIAGDKWQDQVRNEAKSDLDELMKEYQADNINNLVNKLGDIIADSIDVLIKLRDLPLPARINKWVTDNPKISKTLGRTMTVALYGFGIYASIKAFMDWSNLKPQEKAQAVIDIVDVTANIFNDIVKFSAASKLATAQTSIAELMQAGTEIQDAVGLERATQIAGRIGVKVDVELADLGAPALGRAGEVAGEALMQAGSLEETAGKWLTFSKVAGAFATGMTILAIGAACVCTGFQIANDFSTGQPVAIKVLDIIEAVANGVSFLIEGGLGIAALASAEVCSVVPVIGAVVAVVGIVVAIVTMFIHRKPPETPEEKFVTDHSVPFFEFIGNPPTEWLESQKKVMDHLGPSVN